MNVRVLYFGPAADAAGAHEEPVDLPEGATLETLRGRLLEIHPALAPLASSLRYAVGGTYARGDPSLESGVEVAVIPPVSGGAPEDRVRFVEGPVDGEAIAARVASPEAGAVCLFFGSARAEEGPPRLVALEYVAYEPMATETLSRLREEIMDSHGLLDLAVAHRLGRVAVGERSVAIAAAAPRRAEAFAGCRAFLDRLKEEAPIWKRAVRADGSADWVGQKPEEE
ncbi:MAG: molybdenum cofactor biosynthesis protein MoaE [Candidatus Eisenbacteria bacterium]|nr:molybdenum cofactor biosynthesis protein MoaE [Candidatus Eisenbacteria bacterium]